MLPILVLQAGTTFPHLLPRLGDFDCWTIEAMGLTRGDCPIQDRQRAW
jgi:hypothetical protein